jgi:Rrf2 family iron-sulfur cluster assembly transcriptional regulator
MELSTKGRYAVMALIDLTLNGGEDGSVSLIEIAKRQNISLSYLEQLFAKMRKAGVVTARRGPNGGYRLAKPAKEISLASVVSSVDESMQATACGSKKKSICKTRTAHCVAHDLWVALTQHINDFMSKVSLEDVVADDSVLNNRLTAAQ